MKTKCLDIGKGEGIIISRNFTQIGSWQNWSRLIDNGLGIHDGYWEK